MSAAISSVTLGNGSENGGARACTQVSKRRADYRKPPDALREETLPAAPRLRTRSGLAALSVPCAATVACYTDGLCAVSAPGFRARAIGVAGNFVVQRFCGATKARTQRKGRDVRRHQDRWQ